MLRFSDFEVDLQSRELRKAGAVVRLQDQPFRILTLLLERPGDVVTRDDIRSRLWPDGTFVDFEHSVNAAIKRLRAALGDTAEHPRFVETLHRRGYRFIGALGPDRYPTPGIAGTAAAIGRRPRLVVLPFTNMSEQAQDYFSDGLTEEMIAQMGRRCAHRIGVLARTSSMLYKNVVRGANDIGEALHADFLVEGSVRRDGDRVRITAQLIETKTETHLWAESYDRRLEDCLAVQTEVASRIAHALALELLPAPAVNVAGTSSAAAYQAFLQGRFHWNRPGDVGLHQAIDAYDQAISLDTAFGRAYSARARARIALCEYYRARPVDVMELARQDATAALRLDPDDAEAHVALAEVHRVLDWDPAGAEIEYRAALAVNPNNDAAHRYFAQFLAGQGRREAIAIADRACDLDPLCLMVSTAAAGVRYHLGDFADAIRQCRHGLDMDPSFGPARRRLAVSLAALGRYDEALDEFRLIAETQPDAVSLAWMGHTLAVSGQTAAARAVEAALRKAADGQRVPPFHFAILQAGLGDLAAAFALLEQACADREIALDTLDVEPRLAGLRSDARYAMLRARLGARSEARS